MNLSLSNGPSRSGCVEYLQRLKRWPGQAFQGRWGPARRSALPAICGLAVGVSPHVHMEPLTVGSSRLYGGGGPARPPLMFRQFARVARTTDLCE